MVTIENNYILSEYDKKLSFIITNELKDEVYESDAVICTNTQNNECLELLADVCNNDVIIPINFKDLYGVFHDSGNWYYKEYTCTVDDINNNDLYVDYDNIKASFIVFKIGKSINLNNLEDILENIKQGREKVEVTFSCIFDETFEPYRIDMYVYIK